MAYPLLFTALGENRESRLDNPEPLDDLLEEQC
jgi:hypothetical protein